MTKPEPKPPKMLVCTHCGTEVARDPSTGGPAQPHTCASSKAKLQSVIHTMNCPRCDQRVGLTGPVVTADGTGLEKHDCQPKKKCLRVYIVGSHSVGKTHLARWIAKTYGLPLVTEVARSVLAERELPLEVLRADIERTAEFQAEVFRRQAIEEDAAGDSFVSDRAFDNLAYAAAHTIGVSKIMSGATSYADRLKKPGSVIFFVRPHRELLAQDGVRENGTWEEVIRIDGMIRFLLELHDLDHVDVSTLSMAERVRTVRAVLGAHEAKPL